MLVLSRKLGERIVVNDEIEIVVSRIKGNRVSIAIEAPKWVSIQRGELTVPAAEPEETVG
ncbi:carbon storage regulator [Stieleria mannarensis]|uniref:carbon storage regulator n=1 Tax=Stieleria mannarensis TaxID=2755585 RepID=UPI0016040854|nr:carbon storage regulator [Rhodopirellula sp. JC639]